MGRKDKTQREKFQRIHQSGRGKVFHCVEGYGSHGWESQTGAIGPISTFTLDEN